MSPHEDRRHLHECGQAHSRAHVVAEDEEGSTVGAGLAVQGNTVQDGTHGVLTNTEVEDATVVVTGPLVG